MESDISDEDYMPITMTSWGEQNAQQQQPLTSWGNESVWKSLIIPNTIVKEGCKGSGSLHRYGRNYKPIDEGTTIQQQSKDSVSVKTYTSQSSRNRGSGRDGTDSSSSNNSNSSSNSSSNRGDKNNTNNGNGNGKRSIHESRSSTSSFSLKRGCTSFLQHNGTRNHNHAGTTSGQQSFASLLVEPSSPRPTLKCLSTTSPQKPALLFTPASPSTPTPTPASSPPVASDLHCNAEPLVESTHTDTSTHRLSADHQCNQSHQNNISELCDRAWTDWVKKMTEANKNMLIGLGFDSNYSTQLGDKRKPPPSFTLSQPLLDLKSVDDDELWNNINLSIQHENKSSNNNKNNKNNIQQRSKGVDWLSSWEDTSSSTSQSSSLNDSSSSSSSTPHQLRFADQDKQRYSTTTKQTMRPFPQNYSRQDDGRHPTHIVVPSEIAAPPPSYNPVLVSQQLELQQGRKVSIRIRKLDDPVAIAFSICQTNNITVLDQIQGLARLLVQLKATAMQRHKR